ncbi:hypothetical protein PHISP_06575 [Aspergillus sp. HF37]|nr:hypothetical protein PHISP_06575 [Aspergillus sp. HF37]
MSAAALDPARSSHSAKRSRSDCRAAQDDDDYYSSSEFLSDDSGRFDDADESEHSAKKRRRDNGWPFNGLGSADNSPSRRRRQQHRRRKSRHRDNSRSPRSSSSSVGRDERPRRSRFVEERMCDSVSERPPSIFTGDNNARAESRQSSRSSSGIFRFGRAIAAAFNPFGSSWRMSTSSGENDAEMRSRDEDIARVERAYEELKRSGYKGTAKGNYTQQAAAAASNGNRVDSATTDQTWKTIQDKLEGSEPPASGRQSRQDSTSSTQFSSSATPSRRDSGTLFRSSLQDLRRAKSSLAVATSIKRSDAQAETGECSEVRKKKSRKELQKQAKLIKKVSNLEEKLERARRELREVAGHEETEGDGDDAPKSLCMDSRVHPRKFVPGALPTLPSERLLDAHAASASPEPMPKPEHAAFTALSPKIPQIAESHEETHHGDLAVKKQRSTPKPPKKLNDQALAATDSPPLKRKSPDPASAADSNNNNGKPRAAEVKQSSSSPSSQRQPKKPASGVPVKHRRPSPPPPTQRMTTTKSSQRLRMRKARSDLRSATGPESSSVDANEDEPSDRASKPLPSPGPGPSPASGRRRTPSQDHGDGDDYVPPVPPIPKDIVAATAKVDSGRSFKEREMRSVGGARDNSAGSPSGGRAQRVDEEFRWPEEFF